MWVVRSDVKILGERVDKDGKTSCLTWADNAINTAPVPMIDRRCCWGVATTLLREPDRTYSASKHNMVTH